jgi:hypothetical protein
MFVNHRGAGAILLKEIASPRKNWWRLGFGAEREELNSDHRRQQIQNAIKSIVDHMPGDAAEAFGFRLKRDRNSSRPQHANIILAIADGQHLAR